MNPVEYLREILDLRDYTKEQLRSNIQATEATEESAKNLIQNLIYLYGEYSDCIRGRQCNTYISQQVAAKKLEKEGRIDALKKAFAAHTSTFDILQDYKEYYGNQKKNSKGSGYKVVPSEMEMLATLKEDLKALTKETKWYKFHIFREFVGKLADATYRKITSNQTLAERAAIRKTRANLRRKKSESLNN